MASAADPRETRDLLIDSVLKHPILANRSKSPDILTKKEEAWQAVLADLLEAGRDGFDTEKLKTKYRKLELKAIAEFISVHNSKARKNAVLVMTPRFKKIIEFLGRETPSELVKSETSTEPQPDPTSSAAYATADPSDNPLDETFTLEEKVDENRQLIEDVRRQVETLTILVKNDKGN